MTLDADPTRVPSGASVLEVSGLFKCCEQDLSRAPLESMSGFTSQILGIWLFVFRSCAFLTVSGISLGGAFSADGVRGPAFGIVPAVAPLFH